MSRNMIVSMIQLLLEKLNRFGLNSQQLAVKYKLFREKEYYVYELPR